MAKRIIEWYKSMVSKSLTRADLAEAVYEQVGLSRQESSALVESVFEHIADSIIEEQLVKIASFGTFVVRQKSARVGRNPKTGVEATIEPRSVVVFRASQVLKSRINGTWDGQHDDGDA